MTLSTDPSVLVPVPTNERIAAIDTLRGFALLGILVMNIIAMAYPMAAYFNPMVYGGTTGANFGAWAFAHLFFDLKMMAIFSMLFGAGMVLMTKRAEAAGRRFGGIHYRRTFWLLIIGILHSYFVWHGDILVTYALCGFVLFLFRRKSARTLIVLGLIVLIFGALLSVGGGFAQGELRNADAEIRAMVAAGEEMTPRRQALVDQWKDLRSDFAPTPDEVAETVAKMRGTPGEVLAANVHETIGMHTQAVPFFLFWRATALMLLGMGLMKAGVFTAQRSPGFYRKWIIFGFGLGLPVIVFGMREWSRLNYDFIASFLYTSHFNYFASVLVALGWVGIVMRLCQSGKLAAVRARLAAVGRMALSNYLLQSILGVLIFSGYGLGLFGSFGRFSLWWFIVGIWAVQLIVSPWWLARYRFGPAEWLWRTLTYMRKQPMQVRE